MEEEEEEEEEEEAWFTSLSPARSRATTISLSLMELLRGLFLCGFRI